jgi:hypothetical protein
MAAVALAGAAAAADGMAAPGPQDFVADPVDFTAVLAVVSTAAAPAPAPAADFMAAVPAPAAAGVDFTAAGAGVAMAAVTRNRPA